MSHKKWQPRFRYTEQQWNIIINNLKKSGFKNKSSFIRSRINDIHIHIMDDKCYINNNNKKKYSVTLDEETISKIIQIKKIMGKSATSIIKNLILDPMLGHH